MKCKLATLLSQFTPADKILCSSCLLLSPTVYRAQIKHSPLRNCPALPLICFLHPLISFHLLPLFSISLLLLLSGSLWVFTLSLHLAAPWPHTELFEKTADGESRPFSFTHTHTHSLSFYLFLTVSVSCVDFGLFIWTGTFWRCTGQWLKNFCPINTHRPAPILQVGWNRVLQVDWHETCVCKCTVNACMCLGFQVVWDCVFIECIAV